MTHPYKYPSLEKRLLSLDGLTERVQGDPVFARALYAALCNNDFRSDRAEASDKDWSCSWRYAGGLVAQIGDIGEDYMDYYCSGNEGNVTPEIHELLASVGWSVIPIPVAGNQ